MQSTEKTKHGFTLLETLVAFTVFSLFMIAVHKSFVSGLKGQETANWSNSVGQAVRSEFALIGAGLAPGQSYEKDLFGRYVLEVSISSVPAGASAVPINASFLRIAVINVRDTSDDSSFRFQKIVFMEPGS